MSTPGGGALGHLELMLVKSTDHPGMGPGVLFQRQEILVKIGNFGIISVEVPAEHKKQQMFGSGQHTLLAELYKPGNLGGAVENILDQCTGVIQFAEK